MYRRSIASCLCLLAVSFFGHSVLADQHQKGDAAEAATDSKSLWVTSIARLGSSDQFVAATADGLLLREASVFSFDGSNPNQFTALYSHPAAVWCVDSTGDGGKVASVDYRGNLVIYDTASSKATTQEKAFERWCQALVISPDDKSVVAGNEAGKVLVWDLQANKVAKTAELDGHAVTGLAFSPDGSQVAASDGGGHVHLLKWPGLEEAGKIEMGEDTAWCVTYVDEGKNLLVGSSDGHLYRCEAKADAKPESVAKGGDWITQLAVSPTGQVAAGEIGGTLHFPSTGGTDSMDASSGVWTLCWNGDQQLFAGTRKDGVVIASRSWKWTQPAPPPAEEKTEAEPGSEAKEEMKEEKAAVEEKPKADEKPKAEDKPKSDDKPKPADKPKDDGKKPTEKPAKKDAKPDPKAEANQKDAPQQPAADKKKADQAQPADQAAAAKNDAGK